MTINNNCLNPTGHDFVTISRDYGSGSESWMECHACRLTLDQLETLEKNCEEVLQERILKQQLVTARWATGKNTKFRHHRGEWTFKDSSFCSRCGKIMSFNIRRKGLICASCKVILKAIGKRLMHIPILKPPRL